MSSDLTITRYSAAAVRASGQNRAVLNVGVIVLGVTDRERAEAFWSAALGWDVRRDGFGGWVLVLTPPDGRGTPIALQVSETPPPDYPRLHLDLHVHGIAEQIAYLSRHVTLQPGDVIATGTPAGVGIPRGEFLKVGDEVKIEIDGCGTLVNRMVADDV